MKAREDGLPHHSSHKKQRGLLRRNVPLPFAVAFSAACFLFGMATQRIGHPHSYVDDDHPFDRTPRILADTSVATKTAVVNDGGAALATAVVTASPSPAVVASPVVAAVQAQAAPVTSPAVAPPGYTMVPLASAVPAGVNGNKEVDVLQYQVLSWNPRIVYYPNFMSPEICEHIRKIAQRRLTPSSLALRAGDTAENTKDVRTSQGTFITGHDDPEGKLALVEKRIADVTLYPIENAEPFNVLKYEIGQKYDSHFDTFDPESYGPQYSQRVASFLLYLNEWEEGGETVFPLEGPGGIARLAGIDYRKCDMGLRVKPARTGDAVVFWNMNPNGTFDKHALHGGCPVKKGTKWVMTRWIRDKGFGRIA